MNCFICGNHLTEIQEPRAVSHKQMRVRNERLLEKYARLRKAVQAVIADAHKEDPRANWYTVSEREIEALRAALEEEKP